MCIRDRQISRIILYKMEPNNSSFLEIKRVIVVNGPITSKNTPIHKLKSIFGKPNPMLLDLSVRIGRSASKVDTSMDSCQSSRIFNSKDKDWKPKIVVTVPNKKKGKITNEKQRKASMQQIPNPCQQQKMKPPVVLSLIHI
eukprot:TRINITY_DN5636_c0_g1_i1.p2 TRINITY_DN5636_c0_g1~~TRINITY_DN5636_c0_g1_i1.p2  ORF type:complete len:141 (+),score=24.70 TRINITY_DN5636_c0_g1_i1:65-487(+)